MTLAELSPSAQNYLKVIWGLSEWSSAPVTASDVAARTGLKLSSVSDGIRKLTQQGFVDHAPYGAIELTAVGRSHALAMVRRHRLIESFLVSTLGYRSDQVHAEAESLEHAASDFMIDRIDELLGFPTRDPHGDPIPSADGVLEMPRALPLTQLESDGEVEVQRISDADAALLGFLERRGIVVGVRLKVAAGAPYSDAIDVKVAGSAESVTLGRAAAGAVFVSPIGDGSSEADSGDSPAAP